MDDQAEIEPQTTPVVEPAHFTFTGDTYEWLGIWVINLFLSIVTLGIYSAWAKVRQRKYFYQNTWVAGRSFDYHATGGQILVGRLIVIAGFVVYSLLASVPVLALVMPLVLLAVLPWLVVRALRFNAGVSSWANVRFGFDGRAGRAFLVYVLYPILAALTAYLTWPFADRAQRRYTVGNHRLGAAPFHFDARIGAFYGAFLAALAWVAVFTIIAGAAVGPRLWALFTDHAAPEPGGDMVLIATIYGFFFLALLPASAIYRAFLRNVIFNGAMIDRQHRLHSDIHPMRYAWIMLSNAVLVIVSMGLLLPWTQIRLARYSAAHTRLLPGGSLDGFAGELEARTTAIGDAYADLDGFDVGLPI